MEQHRYDYLRRAVRPEKLFQVSYRPGVNREDLPKPIGYNPNVAYSSESVTRSQDTSSLIEKVGAALLSIITHSGFPCATFLTELSREEGNSKDHNCSLVAAEILGYCNGSFEASSYELFRHVDVWKCYLPVSDHDAGHDVLETRTSNHRRSK